MKIGNLKKVRFLKVLPEGLELKGLLISPGKRRSGWSEAFAGAAGKLDESTQELFDLRNEWDEKGWQW